MQLSFITSILNSNITQITRHLVEGMMSQLNKILYVEDQKDIQIVAQYALESIAKFNIKTCNNGQEALEVINNFSPDLVLLDVMMPIMDGPTTLDKIKQQDELANIPIIFMTAKILPGEVSNLMDLGATGVITKPFDPVTLGDQIREIYNSSK